METEDEPNRVIGEVLYRLSVGVRIEPSLIENAFKVILTDPRVKSRDAQLGALLSGLMVKGVAAEEIVLMIRTALNIDGLVRFKLSLPANEKLVGVAGSGKKGLKTFNISTPACFVAAGAGAYVTKPGSRATSSISGSIDFSQVVGANCLPTNEMSQVLLETRFGLFEIESLIPKFDEVYGGRTFGPTPLSFGLPAVANPMVCDALLYGVSHPNVALALDVLNMFANTNVLVATSSDDSVHYIDELSPLQTNLIGRIRNGVVEKVEAISVNDITGSAVCTPNDLRPGESLIENVQRSVMALAGRSPGPGEDAIAFNAAAILVLADKAHNLREGFVLARECIRNGSGIEKLKEFIEATGGSKKSLQTLLGGTL